MCNDVACAAREEALHLGARDPGDFRDPADVRELMSPEALLPRVGQDLPVNRREAEAQLQGPLLSHLGRPFWILEEAEDRQRTAGRHGIGEAKAVPELASANSV